MKSFLLKITRPFFYDADYTHGKRITVIRKIWSENAGLLSTYHNHALSKWLNAWEEHNKFFYSKIYWLNWSLFLQLIILVTGLLLPPYSSVIYILFLILIIFQQRHIKKLSRKRDNALTKWQYAAFKKMLRRSNG